MLFFWAHNSEQYTQRCLLKSYGEREREIDLMPKYFSQNRTRSKSDRLRSQLTLKHNISARTCVYVWVMHDFELLTHLIWLPDEQPNQQLLLLLQHVCHVSPQPIKFNSINTRNWSHLPMSIYKWRFCQTNVCVQRCFACRCRTACVVSFISFFLCFFFFSFGFYVIWST